LNSKRFQACEDLLTASRTAALVPEGTIGGRGRAGFMVALLAALAAAIAPDHAWADSVNGKFLHVSDIHF
jgi:hypothetical protein